MDLRHKIYKYNYLLSIPLLSAANLSFVMFYLIN